MGQSSSRPLPPPPPPTTSAASASLSPGELATPTPRPRHRPASWRNSLRGLVKRNNDSDGDPEARRPATPLPSESPDDDELTTPTPRPQSHRHASWRNSLRGLVKRNSNCGPESATPTPPMSAPSASTSPDDVADVELPPTRQLRHRRASWRNSLRGLVKRNSDTGRASRRWSRRPATPSPPEDVDEAETDVEPEDPPPPTVSVRPATPMPPALPAPPPPPVPPVTGAPPAPRAFPAPGTLVVVQGVVHTTDIPPATPTPAISSSSIDVLGTLLTVAAQATAASLLTGSGSTSFLPRAVPASSPPSTSTSSTRRTPWSALRDRLATPPASFPPFAPAPPGQSPQDERAVMLAEMARAFNLGLGIGVPPRGSENSEGSEAETPVAPEPAAGTFERFLVDLQAELRVALGPASAVPEGSTGEDSTRSEDEHPGSDSNHSHITGHEDAGSAGSHARIDSNDSHNDLDEQIVHQGTGSDSSHARTDSDDSAHLDVDADDERSRSQSPNADSEPPARPAAPTPVSASAPVPAPSPPPSPSLTPAVNWWRLYRFPPIVARGPPSAGTPTPSTPGSTLSAPSTVGWDSSASTAPSSPALSGEGASPSSDTPAATPADAAPTPPSQTVVPVIVVGLQSVRLGPGGAGVWGLPQAAARAPPSTSPAPSSTADASGQSMGSAEAAREEHEWGADVEAARANLAAFGHVDGAQDVYEADVMGEAEERERREAREMGAGEGQDGDGESSVQRRRRSWWRRRSAARGVGDADAEVEQEDADWEDEDEDEDEEEVREGRRDGDEADGQRAEEGATAADSVPTLTTTPVAGVEGAAGADSSRTFLIYVIGGYYPPEHGILAGGGVEGFEALLELGELLGPPRTPTASKADIARAGLAVLHQDALEREGALESCVDCCLICLDDYDPADEIRLLTCRHAFHKTCVDRWLETGRNNCPACRTTGVPT